MCIHDPLVEYFVFVVDCDDIHPSPRKLQAIQEVQVPENPTELKSFLGLVNYTADLFLTWRLWLTN